MIRIKSFKEMVKNLNIYEPQKIVFAKEGKIINANFNQLSSILFPVNDRVTIKCPDCNHEHTFYVHQEEYFYKIENSDEKHQFDKIVGYEIPSQFYAGRIKLNKLIKDDKDIELNENGLVDITFYIDYLFRCSNKNEHIQKLTLKIVLRHGEAFIVKISQDPINNVLVENESKIYINQLKRFGAIEDFRNAQASKSRNLYAGAITYLRRIFEKMINYYIDIEKPNIKANDHVKVKIDSISEYLDKDFLEIANPIYSLMSKGIHELSDLEIDEFYNLLYAAIMFQLYHQKEIDDGQAARKEIKAGISSHLEKHK